METAPAPTPTVEEMHAVTGIPPEEAAAIEARAMEDHEAAASNPELAGARVEELGALAAAHEVEVSLEGSYSSIGNRHTYTVGEDGKKSVISREKYAEKADEIEEAKKIEQPDAAELLKMSNSDLAKLSGMSESEVFKNGKLAAVDAYLGKIGRPVAEKPDQIRESGSRLKRAASYLAEGLADGDSEKVASGLKGAERFIKQLHNKGEMTDEEFAELSTMLSDVGRPLSTSAKTELANNVYNRIERLVRHRPGEAEPEPRQEITRRIPVPEEQVDEAEEAPEPARTEREARPERAAPAPERTRRRRVRRAARWIGKHLSYVSPL